MHVRGPCTWEKVRRLLALSLAKRTTLHWLRLTNGNVGFLIICFLFDVFIRVFTLLFSSFAMDATSVPKLAMFCIATG